MNGKLHGTIALVPCSITLQTDSAPKKDAINNQDTLHCEDLFLDLDKIARKNPM